MATSDSALLSSGDAPWPAPRQFVTFQVLSWSLLGALIALPALGADRPFHFGDAAWLLVWVVAGLLTSSGVGAAYVAVPPKMLRGAPLIGLLVGACLVGSGVWSLVVFLLEPLTGLDPWAPPNVPESRYRVFMSVRGAFLLALWSALFLVNLLSNRMQREQGRAVKALALADQARLQLLRSQLNPHFLFNALNSVVALISEDPRGAQHMVRDLATLLRKALDTDGRSNTTVAQEVEFVSLYVKCEQVRFESRLVVHFDVAEDVRELLVPPMLLQPLVENAIKHGMHSATTGPLKVTVAVRSLGGNVVFEVSNSGTLQPRTDAVLPTSTGIGLRNVKERIASLFPGTSHFELSEAGGFVHARVQFPSVTP